MTDHRARIQPVTVAALGRRHRFTCSCGALGPAQDKEGAELAKKRHEYETDPTTGWR